MGETATVPAPAPARAASAGGKATLDALLRGAPRDSITDADRIVIFSDLHMGNGGQRDDFLRNSGLFTRVLSDHYLAAGHALLLNGDVEELQRFSYRDIRRRWAAVHELFRAFADGPGLRKLVGNHDAALAGRPGILPAVRLQYGSETIFVFHGHQASITYEGFNHLMGFAVKYILHPLHIRNRSPSGDSRKQYRIERRVYGFSSARRIVSIIGHTHRSLFESMSKSDTVRYKIERLCRQYPEAAPEERLRLERTIEKLKGELNCLAVRHRAAGQVSSLYDSTDLHVPCMFNSGCVIGKNGITAIEICGGRIALVHWFDSARSRKYFDYNGYRPEPLSGTSYHRVVLKQDSLSYVFTRIKLLAG